MCGRYVVKNPVTKTSSLVKSAIQVEDTENYNAHPYQKLPVIKKYNGIPVMSRTGHSYIKMKMKEIGALLGGEMSGHIFFNDRWYGFDDGIYAGLRMLEIISNEEKSSSEIFNELPSSFATPELNIAVDKDGNQQTFYAAESGI